MVKEKVYDYSYRLVKMFVGFTIYSKRDTESIHCVSLVEVALKKTNYIVERAFQIIKWQKCVTVS